MIDHIALDAEITAAAAAAGYTANEVKAGLTFARRKDRREDPPGSFDSAGRWFSAESSEAVEGARYPSRAWPYSQLLVARTAAHCAEVFGAETLLAVRRVARARDVLEGMGAASAHEKLRAFAALKPIRR